LIRRAIPPLSGVNDSNKRNRARSALAFVAYLDHVYRRYPAAPSGRAGTKSSEIATKKAIYQVRRYVNTQYWHRTGGYLKVIENDAPPEAMIGMGD
jgi:ribosomal protein L17